MKVCPCVSVRIIRWNNISADFIYIFSYFLFLNFIYGHIWNPIKDIVKGEVKVSLSQLEHNHLSRDGVAEPSLLHLVHFLG